MEVSSNTTNLIEQVAAHWLQCDVGAYFGTAIHPVTQSGNSQQCIETTMTDTNVAAAIWRELASLLILEPPSVVEFDSFVAFESPFFPESPVEEPVLLTEAGVGFIVMVVVVVGRAVHPFGHCPAVNQPTSLESNGQDPAEGFAEAAVAGVMLAFQAVLV